MTQCLGALMECPKCGLINPDEAERCDCGFDFVTQTLERSYLENAQAAGDSAPRRIVSPRTQRVIGLFLILVGIGLTASEWRSALTGGTTDMESAIVGPFSICMGVGAVVMPTSVREQIVKPSRTLPRWWACALIGLAAGIANYALLLFG
jgi:hypothetical protein